MVDQGWNKQEFHGSTIEEGKGTHISAVTEVNDAEPVSGKQVCQDGVHGLLELRHLAAHHGAWHVQHENHMFVQWLQVLGRKEVHKVPIVQLQEDKQSLVKDSHRWGISNFIASTRPPSIAS